MAAIETSTAASTSSVVVSQLSPQDRSTILAALEDYTNALAIYHDVLENPPEYDNDIDGCILSDTDLHMGKIMEELKQEIREKGTFVVLTREVEKLLGQGKEEQAVREESERLEKLADELRQTIAQEKTADQLEEKRILNELAAEQRETEKLKLIADAELDYVAAWEAARYEQNALRANMEIEKLEKVLNECRVREKNERRVHNERTKFLILDTESFEKKTKEWEGRYFREKEIYEKEIRRLHIEIAARGKELEELEEEYRHKQEFIDTCLTEKETLRLEKERKEHERRSAIRIQAWWRGVMVRRKLGPYRPEEKKKKRPKTKK
ncbi:dynein regulatory complex protein 9 [Halictus rubicundus]|uniref:dynein regulatory complex protein 9 n=1 Tax=Halictus rubicundus TaxID=77578 RepID=UPI004035D2AF